MNKAVESPVQGRLLVLEDVRKSFRHNGNLIEVLKGIDLAVHPGESLAITGASGVGKSTLLNIMGTLEPPTSGVVRFQDRNRDRNGRTRPLQAPKQGDRICLPVPPPAP